MNIAIERLYHQYIQNSTLKTPVEAVERMAAIQGQDYPGAKWSLGLRVPGSTDADIEKALSDKTIVRTWVMRGTLHLVAAADVRWLVALIGKSLISGMKARHKELELDEPTFTRSHDIITKALRDGQALSRKALFALLEENGIATPGQRGVHILMHTSLHGFICQGASERNDPLFMLLDDSVTTKTLAREEAIVELARRYFTTRAPVTLDDFVRWTGLNLTESRAGLNAVKSELEEIKVDGKSYWRPGNVPERKTHEPRAFLLPGFDEFILGYKDRTAAVDPAYLNAIVPGGNGVFMSTIVIDGRVAGIWKRATKKDKTVITLEPFTPLTDVERAAVEAAAKPYSDYLQMPVSVN